MNNELTLELDKMRHSCAHVMAQAVQRLWPQAKFGIGPTIEDGFYYDIDLDHPITPEDLPVIEKEMRKIISENLEFIHQEHKLSEAIKLFKELNQPYKVEIIEDLKRDTGTETVTIYTDGNFTDLCRGPHINNTGQIKVFKLLSVAGAYWRGDERRQQLQRIYGTAFFSQDELKEHLRMLEEAKRRDHRKLGKELDLFSFHQSAPSSPFFHPKGAFIYNRLVDHMRYLYRNVYKHEEIITPQILDVELWHKSGHYDNYRENMYFTSVDERHYALKPMNCPAATLIFGTQKHSYRDLPIRYADFGRLHRYERSGATVGLTRVRTFSQDDAHTFCTPEQIGSEINLLIDMIFSTYGLFGFTDIQVCFATRPEKRVGSDELWDQAEQSLKQVLDATGKPYETAVGDGAFYGPKIDFKVKDALKRHHQLGTIQLDFSMPERFGLEYVGADNQPHVPVMIHRAVLGSMERFMGILIEHVAGAFPFWLAPVQVCLIAVADTHLEYCRAYRDELRNLGFRAELDERNESMGFKIREAQKSKLPFTLVAGNREIERNSFAVRKYSEKDSVAMSRQELLNLFTELNNYPIQYNYTKTP